MGFIKKFLGKGPGDKIGLIKELVRKRVEDDSFAMHLVKVDNLSDFELMGLPEATIVTIVESYEILTKKQEMSEKEALGLIESHRARVASGELPCPLDLCRYVKYRLALEHSHGVPLTESIIEETIDKAKKFFSQFR